MPGLPSLPTLSSLPGVTQINSAISNLPNPVQLGAQLLNTPSPEMLLPGLPTIPIPYQGKSQSKGAPSECWLVDKKTGEQFRFQFNPPLSIHRNNELPIHKGIRSDKGIPIIGSGGEEVISIRAMYYKIDKTYDHYKALENIRNQLSRQKDGSLPIVTVLMPGLKAWDGYIRDFSAELSENCFDGKVSRTITVSVELVEYSPLPEPTTANKVPQDTAFYTVKEDTQDKAATRKSKGAKDPLADLGEPGGGEDAPDPNKEHL